MAGIFGPPRRPLVISAGGNVRMRSPLDDARTKLTMQRTLDFYDFYWRGTWREWKIQDENGEREPRYIAANVPRTRTPPNPDSGPPGPWPLDLTLDRQRYGQAADSARNDAWKLKVNQGEFGITNFTKPLGLRLSKVLGKGGQGIACLFLLTLPDGSKDRLVVKASIRRDDIQDEVANVRASRHPLTPPSPPLGFISVEANVMRSSWPGPSTSSKGDTCEICRLHKLQPNKRRPLRNHRWSI